MSIILFVALCLLQVLDVYSTKRLLDANAAHEANIVMAFLVKKLGTLAGLALPKMAALVLLYLYAMQYPNGLFALVAVYVAVVVNNFTLMRKTLLL